MNQQLREKPDTLHGDRLSIHSIFYSIQGEGPFAGQPAVFIRLAGCNLRCPQCDTDYTDKRCVLTVDAILASVMEYTQRRGALVVLTGGEPFRQDITQLVDTLHAVGYRVQIETNGTLSLAHFPFFKTTIICSPKTTTLHPDILHHAAAFKYVLTADFVDTLDGLPTSVLGFPFAPARPLEHSSPVIYVQPLDEPDEFEKHRHLQAAIHSCLTHGHTLCLQLHKIIGLE